MGRLRHVLISALAAVVTGAVLATTALTPAPAEVNVVAPTAVTVSARATLAVVAWTGSEPRYLVEVATDAAFTYPRSQEAAGSLAVVTGLAPSTHYLVRVSVVTGGGPGPASAPVSFTTPAAGHPYAAPAMALEGTDSVSITASWTGFAPDARYQVELAPDQSFSNPTRKLVSGTKVTFGKLSNQRSYHVRVRVVGAAGQPLSEWSPVSVGKPLVSAPLTVGTYNILKSRRKAWSARKPALVRTILGEDPDVVGLQEATPARTGTGRRQYADLAAALGPDWALTDDRSGSTGETRTVYNTRRLTLVSQGYQPIAGSRKYRGIQRYVTWAVFTQVSTGKQFMFVNTHFVPRTSRKSDGHRVSAARQLVDAVRRANPNGLPVIVAGDFNSGMNRTSGNGVYRAILAGGYRDPLATPKGRLGHAKKTIRAELKTVNRYRRVAPRDAFAPLVDHIFVSPMKVLEWEVVARLDGRGRFVGTIPSDHNMIRATVELP